jgi:DNA-binding CsgD family transcriptional regulator
MAKDANQIKIDNCIAEISSIAAKMPGVVILHDVRDWSVAWMSERGLSDLGITLGELTSLTAEEYYGTYFNSEDAKDYVPKILAFLEEDREGELCNCFQQVRLSKQSDWSWHFSSSKVYIRDDNHKPLLVITMAFPIDSMHHMVAKAARLLEENNFLRKNHLRYASLSEREREVLKLMALGKSSIETAQELFISQNTVETHRKNIRQKLDTGSYFELCEYARAFDLV